MFYRFEFRPEGCTEYVGFFAVANPDYRRKWGRSLKEPKYYQTKENNALDRAWWTDNGYAKYGKAMIRDVQEIIANTFGLSIEARLIAAKELPETAMRGSIQCIEKGLKATYQEVMYFYGGGGDCETVRIS